MRDQVVTARVCVIYPAQGYLAAMSASAYSFVSMLQRFGPLMNEGGSVINLTYMASNSVIPGYGGGMSSAKAVSTALPTLHTTLLTHHSKARAHSSLARGSKNTKRHCLVAWVWLYLAGA